MKKILLVFLVSSFSFIAHAQNFDEWFRQNKTTLKYLAAQITALDVYDGYLNQGYGIARDGLSNIYDFKKEEFDLHDAYFSSLKAINPSIAGYPRIADIISYESSIVTQCKQVLQTPSLSASELVCLQSICKNMSTDCAGLMGQLTDLLTANIYSMTDEERLKRIDSICREMEDRYAFTKSFSSDIQLLASQRAADQLDIRSSLINNGLK
ncbi:MAG TPA: hypothetical protein VKR53_12860 [Puia sp.]|nr:hypothetical protein [Puia sp.]